MTTGISKEQYATTLLGCYLDARSSYEFRERSLEVYESLLEAYLVGDITSDDLVWIRYQLNYAKDELRGTGSFAFYYVALWESAGLPTKEGLIATTGIYECSDTCLMSNYISKHWCFRYPSLHATPNEGRFVYMLFDGDDLVYIGQTKNANTRLWKHQKDKDFDRVSLTNRGLRNGKLNKQTAITLEKQLIKRLDPKLNVQHKPKVNS